jgi:hypothetical protein
MKITVFWDVMDTNVWHKPAASNSRAEYGILLLPPKYYFNMASRPRRTQSSYSPA